MAVLGRGGGWRGGRLGHRTRRRPGHAQERQRAVARGVSQRLDVAGRPHRRQARGADRGRQVLAMSRAPAALKIAPLAALLCAGISGCADEDACKGRSETCLSLTLSGEGVTEADQLEVLVVRQPKPQTPMMPLGEPKPLPFKVAVLWPDGPGTVSVRSYL